ncbi:MAG TPA: M64 family metallopeptidase, partial [Planctomycetota bacterium]|nr:M64 family metallopeptidase [Planctomycetota bacterium]
MAARRWLSIAFLSVLVPAGRQDEGQGSSHPKLPPRLLVLATAEDAASGLLAWSDDESVALLTDRGERKFAWSELRPYSAWRARSVLAGRDAAKRLELAAFCREHKLHRQARWEHAAARALDPKSAVPDLEELRKLDAEAFLPNALGLAPTAVAKHLEKEATEAMAARSAAEKKRHEDRRRELGVSEVTTLAWRGDVSRRLDIVFACDGYAEADQPKYHAIADQLMKAVLKVEPMANYPSYINFHRVSIVEPTSGLRNGKTRLGSKVESGMLTCNTGAAWEVALLAPDADLVFVVANVKDVRASGGHGVLTLDASGDINDTSIHELGHAFADLDDEYVDETVQQRYPAWDPAEEHLHFNTTQVGDVKKVKWHYWTQPPLPKGTVVGCFEGAYFRATGFWRPSPTCRMRDTSDPFCAVCFEQMEKSLYSLVSPIDAASPQVMGIRAFLDDELPFTAQAVLTEGKAAALGGLSAAWYVDGARDTRHVASKDKTTSLRFKGLDLKAGRHEVALRVDFQNKRVRRDDGLLSGHRVWEVEVLPYNRPKLVLTGEMSKGSVTTKLEGAAGLAGVKAALVEGPPGAEIEADGTLRCPCDEALTGARVARVGFVDKDGALLGLDDRTFATPHGDGRNLRPFLRLPPEIEAVEGRPFYHRVDAWDPDGDFLAFSATGLPEGASMDPSTGEILWDPGYAQGGRYEGIKVTATDGQQQVAAT